jgi:hypothetical protein
MLCQSTVGVTGGWGEKGSETGNCQISAQAPKNGHSSILYLVEIVTLIGVDR